MCSTKNGKAARTAGALGEYVAQKVLGLAEPDVEIKTMQLERGRFSVELTQLERQPEKVYVIVVYSRGSYKGNKIRKWEKTIKQAFEDSLEFVIIEGYRLIEIVKAGDYKTRWVEHERRTGGRFVALFKLADAKAGTDMRVMNHGGLSHLAYTTADALRVL